MFAKPIQKEALSNGRIKAQGTTRGIGVNKDAPRKKKGGVCIHVSPGLNVPIGNERKVREERPGERERFCLIVTQ